MSERAIAPDPYDLLPKVPSFTLKSNDVEDGEPMNSMFARSRRGGQDISPELHWSSFPAQTKGFAGTCFDPDAPTGSGFWHWVLVGLEHRRDNGPVDGTAVVSTPALPHDRTTATAGSRVPPPGTGPSPSCARRLA
jgi:phosphatidylethanolamine-binding protein (PEBP) family uncharacterized protein